MNASIFKLRAVAIASFVSVALASAAIAQEKMPGPPVDTSVYRLNELAYKQAARVYGYVYAQRMTLAAMQEQYPQFAAALKQQELQFDTTYGWPQARAEAVVETLGPGSVEKMREQYLKPYKDTWGRKYSEDEVVAFSQELDDRISGKLNSPDTMENMLWLKYAARPSSEIIDGKTKQFNSVSHPKANGLGVTFKVPLSWKAAEGDRPHVVQKWASQNGSGDMTIVLTMPGGDLFKGFDLNAVEQLYAEDMGKSWAPKNATMTNSKIVAIDTAPTLLMDLVMAQEVGGKEVTLRQRLYNIFVKDSLVQLQCIVGRPSEEKDLVEKRFPKLTDLCDTVATTVTIPSQWQ